MSTIDIFDTEDREFMVEALWAKVQRGEVSNIETREELTRMLDSQLEEIYDEYFPDEDMLT